MRDVSSGVRCVQILLIFGNVVLLGCGLALFAMSVFVVADPARLWPLLSAFNNTDIFAGAWISIFTGFSFFLLAILGIYAVMRLARGLLLAYILLTLFVYIFEVASCITAITHRDFLTKNAYLQQMLQLYQNPNWVDENSKFNYEGVTAVWDRTMFNYQCCGVNGPQDWQSYGSSFRDLHPEGDFPWPLQCCVLDAASGLIKDIDACRLGLSGYLNTQGCYDYVSGPLHRAAWGVAWFGFAILCWEFWVLLGTMYLYNIS
ncbi:uroplakin-1b [Lampetra fluviatilis]